MAIQTIKKLEDYVLTNPAGLQGEIQFNNGGSFDTNSTFVYDTSTNRLGVGVSSPNEKLVVAGAIRSTSNAVDWAASDGSIIDYLNGDTRIVAARNGANSSNMTFTTYNAGVAGERVRIDPLGNVGINQSNPATRLQIEDNGDGNIVRIKGTGTNAAGRSIDIGVGNTDVSALEAQQTYIYTTATNSANSGLVLAAEGGTASQGGILFYTGLEGSLTQRMRITREGNIGIGTTNPRNLLELGGEVNRQLRIGGIYSGPTSGYTADGQETTRHEILFSSWRDIVTDTVGAKITAINKTAWGIDPWYLIQHTDLVFSTLGISATSSDDTTEKMRITSAGNVGIGEPNPSFPLQVNGTIRATDGSDIVSLSIGTQAALFMRDAANYDGIIWPDVNGLNFRAADAASSPAMTADINNNVLIGYTSSNGSYKLQVNSQIFATNATIATSDGRYKENVQPISNATDLVSRLNPVQFQWKSHEVHNFDVGKTDVGFIAQEVQEVLSDSEYNESIVISNTLDDEQYLGLAESKMIPLLTAALQEAIDKINILEAKVEALGG